LPFRVYRAETDAINTVKVPLALIMRVAAAQFVVRKQNMGKCAG